nr:hypothetical protein [Aequorivita echinoideorum]
MSWNELKKGVEILDFNFKNMPARIAQTGDWFKPVLESGIDMEMALENLE